MKFVSYLKNCSAFFKNSNQELIFTFLTVFLVLVLTKSFWLDIYPLNLRLSDTSVQNQEAYYLFFGDVKSGSGKGSFILNFKEIENKNICINYTNILNFAKVKIKERENSEKIISGLNALSDNSYNDRKENIILTLYPNFIDVVGTEKDIWLVYKFPFRLYYDVKFKFCPFVIISFFAFIIFYSFFSYVFALKKNENCSVSDIALVSVFVVLLFIPTLKLEKSDVSELENRPLAKFPAFYENFQLNNNWGRQFENYFNDRFFGREQLNNFYKKLIDLSSNVYQNNLVIVDKRKGVFTHKAAIKNLYRQVPLSELENDETSLQKFADLCSKNGSKLYVVVIPDRANIYREDIPYHNTEGYITAGEQFSNYLANKKDLNFTFLYPKKELLEAKQKANDELFFKADTHQTDYGAYVVYLALIDLMKKDYKILNPVSLSIFDVSKNNKIKSAEYGAYDIGMSNAMSLCDEKYLDTFYTYYSPKKSSGLIIKKYDDVNLLSSRAYYPKGINKKVLLIGSSYIEKLYIFIRQTFRFTDKVRVNNSYESNFHVYRFENKIAKEKPDIVIVALNESEALQYIESMYDNSIELEW